MRVIIYHLTRPRSFNQKIAGDSTLYAWLIQENIHFFLQYRKKVKDFGTIVSFEPVLRIQFILTWIRIRNDKRRITVAWFCVKEYFDKMNFVN